MLVFTLPIAPTGKGRHRYSRYTRSFHTPAKTAKTEDDIGILVKSQYPGPLLTEPVAVGLRFAFVPPKRKTTAVPKKKPDLDNAMKLVLDALNGVLWIDDAQVAFCILDKVWSPCPYTKLWVGSLEESVEITEALLHPF